MSLHIFVCKILENIDIVKSEFHMKLGGNVVVVLDIKELQQVDIPRSRRKCDGDLSTKYRQRLIRHRYQIGFVHSGLDDYYGYQGGAFVSK